MLTLKKRQIVKIFIVTLAFALMLLAEPLIAKKSQNRSSRSRSSNKKSQRVVKPSSSSKAQRPSNVATRSPKVTSRPRTTSKPQARVSNPRPPSRIKPAKITKPYVPHSRTTTSSRYSTIKPQISKPSGVSRSTRPAIPARGIKQGTVSSGKTSRIAKPISKPALPVNSIKKQPVVNSNRQIKSSKTSRIVTPVSKPKPTITTTKKQTTIKPANRISTDKTSRIAKPISKPKNLVTTPKKEVAVKSSKRISPSKTGRIATTIKSKKPHTVMTEKSNRESKLKRTTPKTVQITSSKVLTSSRTVREVPHKKSTETGQKRKSMNLKSVDRTSAFPRTKEATPENLKNVRDIPTVSRTRDTIVNNSTVVTESRHPTHLNKRSERHRFHRDEGRSSRIRYEEHSTVRHRTHRHEHIYRDHHNRISHRLIWPRYCFPVYYSHGPFFTFRYVYPYYHRKYIFVSLGGYWPVDYRYIRYYWYGWHPYDWYGYYPIAREVRGDSYNYYTYNYYYADTAATSDYTGAATGIRPVDHTTFADVRERLAQQQAQEPEPETLADAYFDEAVKAFEAGDYENAADKFARAMEFAPDDMILPFAYAQALFAGEKYSQAAEVLRLALEKVTPEKEGVFYPRGLYPDEDILFEQIDRLAEKADLYSYDADLQLLLGYQLLGIGQVDEAVEPLQRASQDLKNSTAAAMLLDLLEKIRANNAEDAG